MAVCKPLKSRHLLYDASGFGREIVLVSSELLVLVFLRVSMQATESSQLSTKEVG